MARSTLPSPDFVAKNNKTPHEAEHVRMYARAYARAQAYAAAFEDGREQRQTFRAMHQGARFVFENVASPNSLLADCPHDWEIF